MDSLFPLYQVDAFTDRPFSGNPAAVCFLMQPRSDEWMQQVAAEMNLSETAFFSRMEKDLWRLRWFTPSTEVELCGHATLATAHILYSTDLVRREEPIHFETLSGRLVAKHSDKGISLDFPATPPEGCECPEGLEAALGSAVKWCGKTRWDLLVLLEDEATVRGLDPDFAALRALNLRGVIVTAPGDAEDTDFVSRFFGPSVGVDEDPVTGSAHCALAPFWAKKLGYGAFQAAQVGPRGGRLQCFLDGERVILQGNAVTVLQGVVTAQP